jgi:hypothetical protein
MKHSIQALTLAAVLLASGSIHAQESRRAPSNLDNNPAQAHQHQGFYLSVQLPVGYRSTRGAAGAGDFDIGGAGPGLSLLAGGTVVPNLVVYGEFSTVMAPSPTLQVNGSSVEVPDATSSTSGFGVGVAYYLMPLNIYFGGSCLLSRSHVDIEDQTLFETDLGVGMTLRAGKEFWVSDHVGLGLGLEGRLGTMNDKDSTQELTSSALSAVLSATYN